MSHAWWLMAWALASSHGVNPWREPARAVLERRCGDCHRADSPLAQPRALAVYTLNDIDFAARMTAAQLDSMAVRISDGASADDADVTVVKQFIAFELAAR